MEWGRAPQKQKQFLKSFLIAVTVWEPHLVMLREITLIWVSSSRTWGMLRWQGLKLGLQHAEYSISPSKRPCWPEKFLLSNNQHSFKTDYRYSTEWLIGSFVNDFSFHLKSVTSSIYQPQISKSDIGIFISPCWGRGLQPGPEVCAFLLKDVFLHAAEVTHTSENVYFLYSMRSPFGNLL